MSTQRVTLVATVLNEYGSLPGWLEALESQTLFPTECIIVDGGSTDGTLEYLQASRLPFPVILKSAPGCNISEGRNKGIASATGDIIVVTDAGTRADRRWIDRIVKPLERDPEIDIVAGFFEPETPDIWSQALASATLPDANEIDPKTFLASSRSVAFRRRWFELGFSYPGWLDYCEDVVFDLQLRRGGARQHTELSAVVKFSPRRNVQSFFSQYYRYARGDGKAGLFFRRHLVRYAVYLALSVVAIRRRPLEIVLTGIAGAAHMRRPVRRILRRKNPRQPATVTGIIILLVAVQSAVGDIAKMVGYPVGLWWRYKRDRSIKYWNSGWKHRLPSGHLRRT